ncbi:hypothetical protein F8M41_018611 [Gigaspora margarita]|uniref:Uncharacterized protein n=1 Tax=Gigaspora margarita TaxID=4874 RepID=A0A8H4AL56_GIGMA|nr:hypothetical protein F8M41_018611 [Gigaspora margarita]
MKKKWFFETSADKSKSSTEEEGSEETHGSITLAGSEVKIAKDLLKLFEDHKKDIIKLSEDHKKDTMKLSEDIMKLSEDHKKDTIKLSEEKFALSEEKYKLMI